jgi:hypothetical protein
VAGWKPAQRLAEHEGLSYPHPLREDLLAAIEAAEARGATATAKSLRDRLELFPVWEENRLAVRAFLRVRTQWRRDGDGSPSGLDGAAVEPMVSRFCRENRLDQAAEDAIHGDLSIMEAHVIAQWSREARARARELERKNARGARRR